MTELDLVPEMLFRSQVDVVCVLHVCNVVPDGNLAPSGYCGDSDRIAERISA